MLEALLDNNNYLKFNSKVANVIGLTAAVYCELLLQESIKNKNDYFTVDRQYIKEKTTINEKEQLELDNQLESIKIIKRESNRILFSIEDYINIATTANKTYLNSLQTNFRQKSRVKQKAERLDSIRMALLSAVASENNDLLISLKQWVVSLLEQGKTLSKAGVLNFQEDLKAYTKGDYEKALKIVKIATNLGYRECSWAIRVYEKDELQSQPQVRTTTQEKATMDSLDLNTFF